MATPWTETDEGYVWDDNGTMHLPTAPDWGDIPSYIPADDTPPTDELPIVPTDNG